jgi:DNA-directed RNA polymerase sigma subunit (sigma70/sigma32)
MSDKEPGWDRKRSEQLRATLTQAEIEALAKRAEADPRSLTLDELGVLFLVTRDRIRAIEGKARGNGPGEERG